MRKQRREARKNLKAQMKASAAAARAHPAMVAVLKQRRRRRMKQVAAVVAIIIAILLLQLECPAGPTGPVVAAAEPEPAPEPKKVVKKKKKRKKRPPKLEGKVDKKDRGDLEVPLPAVPPWLQQFRLQVAARSPRLAACFNGVEKPGALRWSALVHARSGRVTESEVEPAFRGVSLSSEQERCLIAGLTSQKYKLDEPDEKAAARRVSLIFEF